MFVNGRQFFEIDRYLFAQVFGQGPALCQTGDYRLSDMPDFGRRQHRLDRTAKAGQSGIRLNPAYADEVFCRKNTFRSIARFDDPLDAGVGERTSQEGELEHALHANIADKTAPAMQVAVVLLAQQGTADTFSGRLVFHICFHRSLPSGRGEYVFPAGNFLSGKNRC